MTNTIFPQAKREPIAIVGVSCRFPGANSKDDYWKLLCEGESGITAYPPERAELGMKAAEIKRHSQREKGPLSLGVVDDIDRFDNDFFQIADQEAKGMDPQQRLSLELVWQALEDAGLVPQNMRGTRTATYAASVGTSYWASRLAYQDYQEFLQELDGYTMTGGANSILSGRIAYHYDFRGEAVTIDSACSSSLTAVHMACNGLWAGSVDQAVVVGANAILTSDGIIGLSRGKVLSGDGRCRPFANTADGYGRAEGAGAVILMPLARALEQNLNVYCCILNTGANNDGDSGGHMLAPSVKQQRSLMCSTWQQSGYSLNDAQYIEAHGTATPLGDTVEIHSIAAACAERDKDAAKLLIGSCKSNISHTEGAAGVASLIKAALSIKHGSIPPSIGIDSLNERVDWQQAPLEVCQTRCDWQQDANDNRLGGVNSFGFSGTNVHIMVGWNPLLDQVGKKAVDEPESLSVSQSRTNDNLLPISAHSPAALLAQLDNIKAHLQANPEQSPADISYSLLKHRQHLPFRVALQASSQQQWLQQLDEQRESLQSAIKSLSASELQQRGKPSKLLLYWHSPDIVDLIRNHASSLLLVMAGVSDFGSFNTEVKHIVGASIEELFELVEQDEADHTQTLIASMGAEYLLIKYWQQHGLEPDIYWVSHQSKVAVAVANDNISLDDGIAELCLQEKREQRQRQSRFLASDFQFLSFQDKNDKEVSIVTFNGDSVRQSSLVELFSENRVYHLFNRKGRMKQMLKTLRVDSDEFFDGFSAENMQATFLDLYQHCVSINSATIAMQGEFLQMPVYAFQGESHWFAKFPAEVAQSKKATT